MCADPDLSYPALLKNLTLWSTTGGNGLDRVMWSLVHEMRISLVFPVLLFTVVRFGRRSLAAYGLLSLVCTLGLWRVTGDVARGYEEKTFALSLLDTGYYVPFFAAGAYLAVHRQRIAAKMAAAPWWLLVLLFVFAGWSFGKDAYDVHAPLGALNDYVHGAGAAIVITGALSLDRLRAALNHRIPVWLGRISYSLYLIHCPIIYVVSQTFGATWSTLAASAAVIVLSLLGADLMARLIEFPVIRLGKRIAHSA